MTPVWFCGNYIGVDGSITDPDAEYGTDKRGLSVTEQMPKSLFVQHPPVLSFEASRPVTLNNYYNLSNDGFICSPKLSPLSA